MNKDLDGASKKACLLLFLAYSLSCNFAKRPDFPNIPAPAGEGWAFDDRYYPIDAPIFVYIEQFKYSSQLLPTVLAVRYVSSNLKCNPFKITKNKDLADIIIEDHQMPDMLTGEFLRPFDEGKSVMADTKMTIEGMDRPVYIIRVFDQNDTPNQAKLLSHEILHALGLGHNEDDVNDIMYPFLEDNSKPVTLASASVKALNSLYCGENIR